MIFVFERLQCSEVQKTGEANAVASPCPRVEMHCCGQNFTPGMAVRLVYRADVATLPGSTVEAMVLRRNHISHFVGLYRWCIWPRQHIQNQSTSSAFER